MIGSRRTLIVLVGLILLAGVEVGLRLGKEPVAAVKVVNLGETPIVGLEAVCGNSRAAVDVIPPKGSAIVHVGGRGRGTLSLRFRQVGNALPGFQLTDFDAGMLSREGSMMVLEIRSNEFARSVEPDPTPSSLGRLMRNVWSWFGEEPEPSP